MIKHICFDFAGTLFRYTKAYDKVHDDLIYKTYSRVIKKPVTTKLKKEYRRLYNKYKTNSQVFISLGKHSGFWAATQGKIDKSKFIKKDFDYSGMFMELRERGLGISLLTNALEEEVLRILPLLDLGRESFDFIYTGEMVEKKPSLDGFHKVINRAKVKAGEILYVGDRISGEILPAKEVGMKTALVWSNELQTEADYTLKSISGIIELLA